jgi:hypothetical protein
MSSLNRLSIWIGSMIIFLCLASMHWLIDLYIDTDLGKTNGYIIIPVILGVLFLGIIFTLDLESLITCFIGKCE